MSKINYLLITAVLFFLTVNVSNSQSLKEKFETGKKAFYSDDFETANKLFSEILNTQKNSFEIHLYKGMVYYIYFDYDKSLAELSKAIKLEPENSNAYFNRALTYERKENNAEAIKDYTKAIKYNKKNADAYNSRAELYERLEQTDNAIKDYSSVIKLNPKDDIAYYNRGMLYVKKGDKSKAISDFVAAIKIDSIWKNELGRKIEELKK